LAVAIYFKNSNNEMKEKVAILSLIVNALLAGGKIAVGLFSGSAAVLAEGVHSFTDIFSSAIGYVGIRTSQKPADRQHPYGHYKFEVLSGVVITIILLATGLGIIYDAYQEFLDPKKINVGYLAFGVMLFSAVINEIMARIKISIGKEENSISLLSDGFHSRIDVFSSLAVLGGLFLVSYWIYADSILALLVGIYIIKESFSLGKEAVDSLLDVSAGDEIEEEIKKIAKRENVELASLKTQKKGSIVTANLEIRLPSVLKLEEATKIADALKDRLVGGIENLQYVVIQIVSHDVERSFYKPTFGRSFGWQRRGRFAKVDKSAAGLGPDGHCVCPQCGYSIKHKRGVPCSSIKCSHCNINLERK